MEPSKLSEHRFSKGKFTTPLNEIMTPIDQESSWSYGRFPEYIWIGLIIHHFGRKVGLAKCSDIFKTLHVIDHTLSVPSLSLIINMEVRKQVEAYNSIIEQVGRETLSPLLLLVSYSSYPQFAKMFYCENYSIENRAKTLEEVLCKGFHHQSEFATDIRYAVLIFSISAGKLCLQQNILNQIILYSKFEHTNPMMRHIRPMVRSCEQSLIHFKKDNSKYLDLFWGRISSMKDCELFSVHFADENAQENNYTESIRNILEYLTRLFRSVEPLDDKMLVLLGIATYSYKRLLEVSEHKLHTSISGRSAVRVLIENYIMMKYLLKNECICKNIWSDYQLYGIGLYKLILSHSRETQKDLSDSHVAYKHLELLVNEYLIEDAIDIDTRYFNKDSIREKAIFVNEKDLYDLFYDYDSSYEHGLWGAIRESSLLKCNSPSHQYHCVPDYENKQNLKSVWADCVKTMNKIILLLNDTYGVPPHLINKVRNNDE